MNKNMIIALSLRASSGLHLEANKTMNEKNGTPLKDSINVGYEEIVNVPVNEVFPLACPVMEYKWVNGWKCELINCPNGYVELGCKFKEIMSAPIFQGKACRKTLWTAVKHNPENHVVHYQLENKVSTILVKIEMFSMGDSVTKSTWQINYKAKTKKGENLIKNGLSDKVKSLISILALSLKYYCENGEMISTKELIKHKKTTDAFTFSDKHRIILNRVAMSMMRDQNKKKFKAGLPISVVNQ